MSDLALCLGHFPAPPLDATGLPIGVHDWRRDWALAAYRRWQEVWGQPDPDDGTGDVEDFWEMVARLDAATHSGAERLWLWSERDGVARDIALGATGETIPSATLVPRIEAGEVPLYGPLNEASVLWGTGQRAADRYPHWPAFTGAAGRVTTIGGVHLGGAEAEREVANIIANWVAVGGVEEDEPVVIKANRAKHGIWRVAATADRAKMARRVLAALEWQAIYFEALPEALLVQQYLPMEYEYRAFVVNGQVVTGAGCVEEFTPATRANDGRFSPWVRRHRHILATNSYIADEVDRPPLAAPEPLPDLVDSYITVAAQFAAKAPQQLAYAVDLAWSPTTERVVVIEVNGITNAGLYASDPRLVARAMVNG